jgi:hypothetical protein
MVEKAKAYHGSPEDLIFVAKGQGIFGTPDAARPFALGHIPGSKGYGKPEGWIYELSVGPSQFSRQGIDCVLTEDVVTDRRFRPSKCTTKSPSELLGG